MTSDTSNKTQNLDAMKEKLETMLSKSKEELHSLEVEWLHLRSIALRDVKQSKASESTTNLVSTDHNFDDTTQINAQQFNINAVEQKYSIKLQNVSENESEEDF